MSDTPAGEGRGKERPADVSQSQGVQIGSYNRQINYITQLAEGRLARPPRITAHGEVESPYKGLNAFSEADAAFFFGRDQATDEVLSRLVRRLETHVPLVVSGASGAGKSSLLRAGVLPRMSAAGLPGLPGARQWPRATLTPAHAPLAELAAAIAPLTGTDAASLRRSLAADPSGFADIAHSIARRAPNAPSRLVLVIDQFEQTFTQCPDDSERGKFIAALHAAATAGHGPAGSPAALVVLAVRADLETRCAEEYSELAEAVQSRYLLTPMTELQLRLAITGPVDAADATVEPAMADELVRAVRGSSSGVLPHLSHALDQAWRDRARDDVLGLEDYERAGGIEGSIKASADRAYGSLTEQQQMAARPLFMRLVSVSTDLVVSAGRATRSELASGAAASGADAVIEAFAAERLLTVGGDWVEISHEVLLTAWSRLRNWLADDRVDLARYGRLIADAAEWDTRGRLASYLYPTGRLAEISTAAKRWSSVPGRYPALGPVPRDFLNAAGRAAGQARWRRRGVLTGLIGLTVAAVIAAALAGSYAADANQQKVVAQSQALAAQGLSLEQSNPLAADQLAVAAWREAPTRQADAAMTSLLSQQEHSGQLPAASPNGLMRTALSPDGALVAEVETNSHFLRLWDTASGKPLASLPVGPRPGDMGIDAAFSPDGKLLASAGSATGEGYLRLWNPVTGALVRAFPRVPDQFSAIAISRDGKTLFGADIKGNVHVWNLATGRPLGAPLRTGESAVTDIAISPDGKLLAESDVPNIGIWDIATRTSVVKPWRADTETGAENLAFSPDGKLLASANSDGYVRLWNPATGKLAGKPLPAALPVSVANGVAFGPGGELASADGDGYVKLWNPATGKQAGPPMAAKPNSRGVDAVAFSPKTGLLASGGNGTLQLWDAAAERPVGATLQIKGAVQFSPQASLLTSDGDGYARDTHAISSGKFFIVNPTQALSSRGNVFAVPRNNTVTLETKNSSKTIIVAPGADNSVEAIALNSDGKLLAASDSQGQVRLWETATGKPTGITLSADKNGVGSMVFSPDGKLLAAGGIDGHISIWNPVTGVPIRTGLSAGASANNAVEEMAFSADGKMLASASDDGKTRLWDPGSGQFLATLDPPPSARNQAAMAVAFSPDGRLLAVEYSDGTIQLWDTRTHGAVAAPLPPNTSPSQGPGGPLITLRFSRDGSLLLSSDFNGHAFELTPWEVWQYTNPYAALCDEAGAPTKTVWDRHASGIREPSGICADVPPASALHG